MFWSGAHLGREVGAAWMKVERKKSGARLPTLAVLQQVICLWRRVLGWGEECQAGCCAKE